MNEKRIIKKITIVGVLGNILLTAFKMLAGILGKSGAMVSDAIHSLSDVIVTLIAFFGIKVSKKPADDDHPYGHERIECVASLILGLILIGTGVAIGKVGVDKIISGNYDKLPIPGTIALVAAIVSIVVKEAMFWYTRHYAKIIDSSVFMADAWHHRSDALSSVGALIGIGGARLGYPIMDPIASVIICLFILKVGIEIIIDAIKKMMDTSAGSEYDQKIHDFVAKQQGVEEVDIVNSRMFGNKVYVDLEIKVDENLTVREGHDIAENVHELLEQEFKELKHVMLHVNPLEKYEKLRG